MLFHKNKLRLDDLRFKIDFRTTESFDKSVHTLEQEELQYSSSNKLINPADKDNHLENNWVLINAIIEPNNTK